MSSDSSHKGLGCLLVLIALAISIPMEGWAVATLWGWFVVPVFKLPELTIWYATGIATLLQLMRPVPTPPSDDDDVVSIGVKALGRAIIMPVWFVCIGWIIHQLAG